jgi:hypothetical protein
MLGMQSQNNARWKTQCRPGQPVACWIVAKLEGGYKVEFGPDRVSGFLATHQQVALGSQILLQFLGYKNQVPFFNASYGTQAYATMG